MCRIFAFICPLFKFLLFVILLLASDFTVAYRYSSAKNDIIRSFFCSKFSFSFCKVAPEHANMFVVSVLSHIYLNSVCTDYFLESP